MSGEDAMLFLDNRHVARSVRLSRVWESSRKFGRVLVPDRPWEGQCAISYGAVIDEGDRLRMWYETFDRQGGPGRTIHCYAESTDGVRWEKPSLDLVEWRGSKDNNIVMAEPWMSSFTVIRDPGDVPERRYKMLYRQSKESWGANLFAAFSADGLDWRLHDPPVIPKAGDRTTVLFDSELPRPFVAFTRMPEMMDRYRRRIIYRADSADFLQWSTPEPVLIPGLEDSWDLQFYGMPVFRYRDMYLAGIQRLWSSPDRLDVELAISRDTKTWERSRGTFLGNGGPEEWDCDWVCLASVPMIERDGDLWFYHEGRAGAHEKLLPFPRGAIGLATIGKDRFCALEAGPVEGFVETPPFEWRGSTLKVNTVTTEGGAGYAKVEVRGADGEVLGGFSREDAVPAHGGSLPQDAAWRSGRPLWSLEGETVSLRVYLVNQKLYALYPGEERGDDIARTGAGGS